MEQPLGNAIGNAVEVNEAIDTLNGNGPRDLVDLVLELGSMMLVISGIESSFSAARRILETNIAQKKGLKKLAELIEAQGGNPDVIVNSDLLPQPKTKIEINAQKFRGLLRRSTLWKSGWQQEYWAPAARPRRRRSIFRLEFY